jgi:hypothetical protein
MHDRSLDLPALQNLSYPTPGEQCTDEELRSLALAASAGLGRPFQYLEQHHGAIFDVLRPSVRVDAQTGNGFRRMGFHTDDPLFGWEARARHIMIVGLRNPERVPTIVAPIDGAARLLPASIRKTLEEPVYYFELGRSYVGLEDLRTARFGPFPILEFDRETRRFRGRMPTTSPYVETALQQSPAMEALKLLYAAFKELQMAFVVERGNALVFDNHYCVHGRGMIRGERQVARVLINGGSAGFCRPAGSSREGATMSARGLLEKIHAIDASSLFQIPQDAYDLA